MGANGIISFGAGYTSNNPQLFPTNNAVTRNAYVVAPFWSDNDLRLAGSVTYQVFTSQFANVNAFISDTTGTNFTATWMLVAQWNGAHPYPHGLIPTSSALNVVCISHVKVLLYYNTMPLFCFLDQHLSSYCHNRHYSVLCNLYIQLPATSMGSVTI